MRAGVPASLVLRHLATPAHAEGDAPLVFAGVLADEERHVAGLGEVEVRFEKGGEPFAGGALGPVSAWGEVFEPGAGCGEQELASGAHERWKALDELERIGEAAEEIGGVDDVVIAKIGAEVHGIALLEGDAVTTEVVWHTSDESGSGATFIDAVVRHAAVSCEQGGGIDEAL